MREAIYKDSRFGTAEIAAERAADYFAACLMMPRPWVKRCFYDEGFHDPRGLARRFRVSGPGDALSLRPAWTTRKGGGAMKAVCLLRVSSDGQTKRDGAEEGYSIELQRQGCPPRSRSRKRVLLYDRGLRNRSKRKGQKSDKVGPPALHHILRDPYYIGVVTSRGAGYQADRS